MTHWRMPWRDRRGQLSLLKTGVLLVVPVPGLLLMYWALTRQMGELPLAPLIFHSGSYGIWLLLVTLAVTPARRLSGWGKLIVVRRMLGISAFAYVLGHVVVYVLLRDASLSAITAEITTRFSIALACIATLLMVALASTSTDRAISRLGSENWTRLHKFIYVATGLAILHYVLSPGTAGGEPFLMAGLFAWLMGWRALDRARLGASSPALLCLAIGATIVTAAFETAMLKHLRGFDEFETLQMNFTLELGLSPTWKVLLAGLAVAAAPSLRRHGEKHRAIPAQ